MGILLYSCSSDDDNADTFIDGKLTRWVNELYFYFPNSDTPVLDERIEYIIRDNKIVFSQRGGSFVYDDDGNLIEHIIDANQKYVYRYSDDKLTVYVDEYQSPDGSNYTLSIPDFVTKHFDERGNLILQTDASTGTSNQADYIYLYDSNNNLIESYWTKKGVDRSRYKFRHSDQPNPAYEVINNTFGIKNYWLTLINFDELIAITLSPNLVEEVIDEGSLVVSENEFSTNDVLIRNKHTFYAQQSTPQFESRNEFFYD